MQLKDYLFQLAEAWTGATNRTLGGLSGLVMNDGKFFSQLAAGGDLRVGTFERFLAFFRDGSNWPDTVIPRDAAELLERLENIATEERASTGQGADVSREHQEAAE